MPPSWQDPYQDSYGWILRSPRPVVLRLLALNFGVFCLELLLRSLGNGFLENFLALSSPSIARGCIWQWVTYSFLHTGVLALLLNMLMLYFFGNEVEDALGTKRFIRLYLLSSLAGGLTWYGFHINTPNVLVGSSAAINGVILAFGVLYPNRPITLLLFFVLPVTLFARHLAWCVVGLTLLFSAMGGGFSSLLAPLGGALGGFLYARRHRWRRIDEGGPSSWFSRWRLTRSPHFQVLPPANPERNDHFIKDKIDPILEKIAEHGIQSLSREERRLLDEAKDRLP